jgi:hypothetical protein
MSAGCGTSPTLPCGIPPPDFPANDGPDSVLGFANSSVPVPGPLAGAGIPGIVAGCLGLVGLARRRIAKLRGALMASAH